MTCPECSAENPPGHNFCSQCGSRLAPACPDCGTPAQSEDRFCGKCGTALAEETAQRPEPPPRETERRLVSVLFADLVGFTPFSEDRDAEEVRDFLTRYFEEARTVVERFGGTVEKFIGDAVMAVWGAERAREDDAERAVRAALDLVETVGKLGAEAGVPDLAVRTGVLTGEAAVGPGEEGQGLVMGDLVNTASRIQASAEPGTVLVGEATHRATDRSIAYEELGERPLEGKEEPVRVYRATGLLAMRGGEGRAEALEPPFVGRAEELKLLKDLLHATGREERSRLVSILGIAGIGKSRLVWEFKKYVDGLVEDVYWHEGRSPAYGEGVTFWALGEMVRRRAGIAETEEPEEAAHKVRSTLEDHVPEPEERRWLRTRLGALLGLEEARAGDRDELFAAFRTFFERISGRGTTVLVFEDFQWADAGLIDFVEELPDRWRDRPILVITLARPELLERRPGWGARHHVLSTHLGPLAETEMRDLVAGMVPGLPPQMADRILERAAGVPLYAVELVRMLILEGDLVREDGRYRLVREPEELAVPDSLVSVIGARLDRLDPEARALVQNAAVLGQTFTTQALEALTGTPLESLQPLLSDLVRKELLRFVTDPRSPEQGQYAFVQGLIQEVAHERLGRGERKARHLAAARYFEGLEDEELSPVVASHYVDAYRATTDEAEAEELAARARAALRRAAERAASLHSHEQALVLCRQALTVPGEAEDLAPIRERAAASALALARFAEGEEQGRRAVEHYREAGDRSGVLRATRLLATVFMRSGHPSTAITLLEEVASGRGDGETDPDLAGLETDLARAYMLEGRSEEALAATERALEIAERLDLLPLVAEGLVTRGTLLGDRGRRREGTALLEKGLALGRELDLSHTEGRALANLGYLAEGLEETERRFRASLGLSRRIGNREQELHSGANLAGTLIGLGRWGEARALIAELQADGVPEPRRFSLEALLAQVDAFEGDPDGAEARLRQMMERAEAETDPQARRNLAAQRAMVSLAAGRAEEAFRAGIETARRDPFGHFGPRRVAGHAALWWAQGEAMREVLEMLDEIFRRDAAVRAMERSVRAGLAVLDGEEERALALLDEASFLWREVSMPLDLALVQGALARLLGGSPRVAEAREEARRIFEELGARAFLRQLEE